MKILVSALLILSTASAFAGTGDIGSVGTPAKNSFEIKKVLNKSLKTNAQAIVKIKAVAYMNQEGNTLKSLSSSTFTQLFGTMNGVSSIGPKKSNVTSEDESNKMVLSTNGKSVQLAGQQGPVNVKKDSKGRISSLFIESSDFAKMLQGSMQQQGMTLLEGMMKLVSYEYSLPTEDIKSLSVSLSSLQCTQDDDLLRCESTIQVTIDARMAE